MEPIRTIVFDWDGTLHDTAALYGDAFRAGYAWLVEGGYAPPRHYSDAEAAQFIGMNANEMWQHFMPQLPREVTDVARDIVGERMTSGVTEGRARLYPGATDVLARLRDEGFHLAFLSNCRTAYLQAHRDRFGLDSFFERLYCCEKFGWASKVAIFEAVQAELPGDFVVVGDRASDLEVARTWELDSIGCAYGFGAPGELDAATLIAHDVRRIPELIHRLQELRR